MGEEDKRKRRKKKWVATQSQVRGAKRGEAVHKGPTDAANPVRLAAMVDYRTMRVLLLNLSSETKNLASSGLAGQGYEIAIESGLTVDEVLALSPEVLVTEASPTDLSCCGMITQLKARSDTRGSVRIVMVVRGGALERARALDLGRSEVITFPFEALEFAARVRTQFRERQPEED